MMKDVLPSPELRPYISHYWVSCDNRQSLYTILPDGSVDLVFAAGQSSADSWLFGTSTSASEVPLAMGTSYLGVRFRPGQARHFMKLAAKELTDGQEAAIDTLRFCLRDLPEQITAPSIFRQLDRVFMSHLVHAQPQPQRIDQVIHWVETHQGNIRIEEAARMFGKSRRQLERTFLEVVGVPPKLFASIVRFQHAARQIAVSGMVLAEVALAGGYTDQSHMNNEFRRLSGTSPGKFLAEHVAFFQDAADQSVQNGAISRNR